MSSLIRNSDRVKQAIDFTGVQNGKIHPSDVDAVFEFDNKFLILMEVKYKDALIPTGQRLLLERMANAWCANLGKKAAILKVSHDFEDDKKDVPLDKCEVTYIWDMGGKWKQLDNPIPLVDTLNKLGEFWKCNKCKF
jgi:hypothetical protein